MFDSTVTPVPKPKRVHAGDRISARGYNAIVDAVNDTTRGVPPVQNVIRPQSPVIASFIFVRQGGTSQDFFWAGRWDGYRAGETVKVAYSYKLRVTSTLPGFSYAYTTQSERVKTDDATLATETQVIVPSYASSNNPGNGKAQIGSVQITGMDATPSNTTYSLTIDGSIVSTVGTVDANTTAANLAALWNADVRPAFIAITASVANDTVVLTADEIGVPYSVVSSVEGGTGAIGAYSLTVAANINTQGGLQHGDLLLCVRGVIGGNDLPISDQVVWEDLNTSGRAWARKYDA